MRAPRRIRLTPLGRALFAKVNAGFETIARAVAAARHGARDTSLRVSALPLFTSAWLIPRLAAFEARHPEITLAIETTSRVSDLEREGIDVGIRNLRAPSPGLAVRKLIDIRSIPLCARKLTQGANALRDPRDLAQATLIHISARPGSWRDWLREAGLPELTAKV